MKKILIASIIALLLAGYMTKAAIIEDFSPIESDRILKDGEYLKMISPYEMNLTKNNVTFKIKSTAKIYQIKDIWKTKEYGYLKSTIETVKVNCKIKREGRNLGCNGVALYYPNKWIPYNKTVKNKTYETLRDAVKINILNDYTFQVITEGIYDPTIIDYEFTDENFPDDCSLYFMDDTSQSGVVDRGSQGRDLTFDNAANGYPKYITGSTCWQQNCTENDGVDNNDNTIEYAGTITFGSTMSFGAHIKLNSSSGSTIPYVIGGTTLIQIVYADNRPKCEFQGLTDTLVQSSGAIDETDGLWHNIVCTYNSSHICIYVDGIQKQCDASTGSVNNNAAYLIGGQDNVNANVFHGHADNVFICNETSINNSLITQFNDSGFVVEQGNVSDTCTPPASGDYTVDCSDNCDWSSADTIPGNITMSGSGINYLSADWTFTGTNQFVYINSGCELHINSGGSFNG